MEVDRRAVDVYGVLPIQMMERAGRAFARVASSMFLGDELYLRMVYRDGEGFMVTPEDGVVPVPRRS